MSSVHLMDFPKLDKFKANAELVANMDTVRAICSSALFLRDKYGLRVRLPLSEITVIGKNLDKIKDFENIILDELNIKKMSIIDNIDKYAELKLQLNFAKIGQVYGSKIPELMKAIKTNNYEIKNNKLYACGIELSDEYFEQKLIPINADFFVVDGYNILVKIDTNITKELEQEGIARDLIRIIQQDRKNADLNVSDTLDAIIVVNDNNAVEAIQNNLEYIKQQTLIKQLKISNKEEKMQFSFNEKLNECEIKILFSVI